MMIDLFFAGGLLFMLPLTVLAVLVLGVALKASMTIRSRGEDASSWSRILFHLGLLAFVLGILSQAIGLYQMMTAIEAAGDVSPAIVMGGLKVSSIAPIYGLIIFIMAILLRLTLDVGSQQKARMA